MAKVSQLPLEKTNPLAPLLPSMKPYYYTDLGAAYLGDSSEMLKEVPDDSVDLVVTSPPYALVFKKEYGNVHADDYTKWFLSFSNEYSGCSSPPAALSSTSGAAGTRAPLPDHSTNSSFCWSWSRPSSWHRVLLVQPGEAASPR